MDASHHFEFQGCTLTARPSGALWWAKARTLTVSDLHLGKAERMARRAGLQIPPYEVQDTLQRLQSEIEALSPTRVICLGDTFDDMEAGRAVAIQVQDWLTRLQSGREWVWIEGNHDPGPLPLSSAHLAELTLATLVFRHIATPETGEISGHYHPKAKLPVKGAGAARPCFLYDERRVILPAFGTYTGGLRTSDPALSRLMGPRARAVLTGPRALPMPMPR